MTARAASAGESDTRAGVDCQTVVLVVYNCIGDRHTSRGSHIECVGVVGSFGVASGVVDGYRIDVEIGTP